MISFLFSFLYYFICFSFHVITLWNDNYIHKGKYTIVVLQITIVDRELWSISACEKIGEFLLDDEDMQHYYQCVPGAKGATPYRMPCPPGMEVDRRARGFPCTRYVSTKTVEEKGKQMLWWICLTCYFRKDQVQAMWAIILLLGHQIGHEGDTMAYTPGGRTANKTDVFSL